MSRGSARRPWTRSALSLHRHRVVRFGLVGVFNTAFSYSVFAVLQVSALHVHYMLALVVSQVVGTLEAFVLQRALVWRSRGPWFRELMRFTLVYVGSFGANLVLLPLLVAVGHVPSLVAQALVVGGLAIATYIAHREFSFSVHRTARPDPHTAPASARDREVTGRGDRER
ncbi:GtrA family protein [Isoptericola sp. b441]|uniref:GtrA family protein n=1 Tax=Actinotalea lenta TaxID=3064654 RepID=A0ABT9DD10_9CELL|nr:GtrA family protein [Isoptericola sp. b441]MDO8108505.1 GtrA family protein [Isoptericola sp. b441]